MATHRVRPRIDPFSRKNKPCSLSRLGQRCPRGCGGLLSASRLRHPSGDSSGTCPRVNGRSLARRLRHAESESAAAIVGPNDGVSPKRHPTTAKLAGHARRASHTPTRLRAQLRPTGPVSHFTVPAAPGMVFTYAGSETRASPPPRFGRVRGTASAANCPTGPGSLRCLATGFGFRAHAIHSSHLTLRLLVRQWPFRSASPRQHRPRSAFCTP
jgi:hypothetical protein